jgi:TRAP-type C4-dicarboxylate transport system substrate-binding protein
MKRLLLIPVIILILGALILVGCSQSAPAPSTSKPATSKPSTTAAPTSTSTTQVEIKPIELRFGHQNPPVGTTTLNFINPWAKKIEEATKGRVKITLYPAESLFKANEAVEATKGGVSDITWTLLGYYAGRYPLTTINSVPYLNLESGKVDGRNLSSAAINSRILQELYETMPEIQAEYKDVKVLFLHTGDPPTLMTTKKPITKIDDLKGLKLRELAGYPSKMWQAAGASPVLLPMPDVYDALQKGVIDGGIFNFSPAGAYKLVDVLKYYSNLTSGLAQFMVIMNLDTWNRLPKDIQEAIMSVSGRSGAEMAGEQAYGTAVQQAVLAAAEKAGKPLEKVSVDQAEQDKLKKLAMPLWDQWVTDMKSKGLEGQKVLDATLKLLDKYKP